jgi:hypothetical protein
MAYCDHLSVMPDNIIQTLPHSQAGAGRHKCVICAYTKGVEAGKNNVSKITKKASEKCSHHKLCSIEILLKLPDSQAGEGRHKCAVCAYDIGFKVGILECNTASDLSTIEQTHGPTTHTPETEGKKVFKSGWVSERSMINRLNAIKIHGTTCKVCGFNFDDFYSKEYARSFIEIHHLKLLAAQGEAIVNPEKDLVPVCSNCHSMAHRRHDIITSVEELKILIKDNGKFEKAKNS